MHKNIKDKLFNYEAQPPEKVWQSIEDALNTPVSLKEKLYHFQEEPKSSIWENIAAALDDGSKNQEEVIRHSENLYPILKYVAAAAILLFLLVGTIWIVNRTSENKNVVQNTSARPQDENTGQRILPLENSVEGTNKKAALDTDEAENESSENINQKKDAGRHFLTKATFIKKNTKRSTLKPIVSSPKEITIVQNELVDKYMIYSTASGNTVKLPKKLYTLFSCATDPDISQAIWCKQNILSLQQKVAQSSSASTDFTAMLYMIKELQENQ